MCLPNREHLNQPTHNRGSHDSHSLEAFSSAFVSGERRICFFLLSPRRFLAVARCQKIFRMSPFVHCITRVKCVISIFSQKQCKVLPLVFLFERSFVSAPQRETDLSFQVSLLLAISCFFTSSHQPGHADRHFHFSDYPSSSSLVISFALNPHFLIGTQLSLQLR